MPKKSNIEVSMASYYAARSKEYERIYDKPERQDDLRRLRSFVEHTFADAHVLELACGTGYWTEIVARSASSVVATDLNDEVLAIARTKPMAPGRVTFRREDAYALAPAPRFFTAGLAAFWWSHVPKARLRSFLDGFHRRFAPGATIVFIDNVYVEGSSTPLSRADESGNTYQSRKLDDGSTHEVLKNFPDESELRAAVEGLATALSRQQRPIMAGSRGGSSRFGPDPDPDVRIRRRAGTQLTEELFEPRVGVGQWWRAGLPAPGRRPGLSEGQRTWRARDLPRGGRRTQ